MVMAMLDWALGQEGAAHDYICPYLEPQIGEDKCLRQKCRELEEAPQGDLQKGATIPHYLKCNT